jgi:uncharacterized protein YcbK (DUF882 family)
MNGKNQKTMIRYFSQADFNNANPPCSMADMNQDTLKRFDKARHIAGIPFYVNSAFRTVEHERRQGRNGTSSHTTGRAMDIRAIGGRNRYLVVNALLKAGFNRIGVHERFIHADDDPNKDQQVIWFY